MPAESTLLLSLRQVSVGSKYEMGKLPGNGFSYNGVSPRGITPLSRNDWPEKVINGRTIRKIGNDRTVAFAML